MKSSRKILGSLFCLSGIAAIIMTFFRTFIMFKYFNANEGLYQAVSTPSVFSASLAVICVVLGICAFIFARNFDTRLPKANGGIILSGAFCGFMFIVCTLMVLLLFLGDILSLEKTSIKILFFAMILFGILSALYYFKTSSLIKTEKLSTKILSICPMMWGACYLIYLYFDSSMVINSSERLYIQIATVFLLFYFTSESRYQLEIARPQIYFAISLPAVILLTSYCIPHLILSAKGVLDFSIHTLFCALSFALLIYICSRLYSFFKVTNSENE